MQTKQTKAHNLNRVAEVWMDEYSSIFYNTSVHSAKNYNTGVLDPDPGNIDSRVALREKHKCKSFDWYVVTTLSCHLSRPLSPLPFNKPHPFLGLMTRGRGWACFRPYWEHPTSRSRSASSRFMLTCAILKFDAITLFSFP